MNINPLANQKRSYRLLVLFSILSTAVLIGWILAQLILPNQSSASYDSSFVIEGMETELIECTFILSLDLPNENHAARKRQLNLIGRKLTAFERRLERGSQNGNIDAHVLRQFQKRSQRLKKQLLFLSQEQQQEDRHTWNPDILPIGEEEEVFLMRKRSSTDQQWKNKRQCFKKYQLPRH